MAAGLGELDVHRRRGARQALARYPIAHPVAQAGSRVVGDPSQDRDVLGVEQDRKSTRLNSSHVAISYAVFCLKKKKTANQTQQRIEANEVHAQEKVTYAGTEDLL